MLTFLSTSCGHQRHTERHCGDAAPSHALTALSLRSVHGHAKSFSVKTPQAPVSAFKALDTRKLISWPWFTGCLPGSQNTSVNAREPTEAGGSRVQGRLCLHREFKASLGHMRPWVPKTILCLSQPPPPALTLPWGSTGGCGLWPRPWAVKGLWVPFSALGCWASMGQGRRPPSAW